jgi:hypothetical protein
MQAVFGIMQGRLSPPEDGRFQSFPRHSWRQEFTRAREVGLSYIEWIYDEYGATVNPIASQKGVAELNALKQDRRQDARDLWGLAHGLSARTLLRSTADAAGERAA